MRAFCGCGWCLPFWIHWRGTDATFTPHALIAVSIPFEVGASRDSCRVFPTAAPPPKVFADPARHFSYRTLEQRIPQTHPLRKERVVDGILGSMHLEFEAL